MKLEDQVTPLDLSIKLKELGVAQESLFYWNACEECMEEYKEDKLEWKVEYGERYGKNISAFTVAELGNIFSERFETWSQTYLSVLYDYSFEYGDSIKELQKFYSDIDEYCINNDLDDLPRNDEVIARAQLLIHILESEEKHDENTAT